MPQRATAAAICFPDGFQDGCPAGPLRAASSQCRCWAFAALSSNALQDYGADDDYSLYNLLVRVVPAQLMND